MDWCSCRRRHSYSSIINQSSTRNHAVNSSPTVDVRGEVAEVLAGRSPVNFESVNEQDRRLREMAENIHETQLERIRDGSSKTRHSILVYAIIGNMLTQSKQNLKLLKIYAEVVEHIEDFEEFDME